MGRPKGSKNKPKLSANVSASERIAQIDGELAELEAQVTSLDGEIAETSMHLSELKKQLRAAKRNTKKRTDEKEALVSVAEAEERARVAQEIVNKYLAEGKTVDDLKQTLGI